jgi:hypothetical protein
MSYRQVRSHGCARLQDDGNDREAMVMAIVAIAFAAQSKRKADSLPGQFHG